MPRRRIAKLERLRSSDDDNRRTLSLFERPGRRRGSWLFFRPEQVPEFEGEFAHFEIERLKGPGWRVLRRVDRPE